MKFGEQQKKAKKKKLVKWAIKLKSFCYLTALGRRQIKPNPKVTAAESCNVLNFSGDAATCVCVLDFLLLSYATNISYLLFLGIMHSHQHFKLWVQRFESLARAVHSKIKTDFSAI